MNTDCASIAYAVIRQPSIRRCGLRPMISRSLNAPGSDSSALTTTYFRGFFWSISDALRPIGKPAPPRPRSVASVIALTTSGALISRARASDRYPPTARYSSRRVRSRSSTWARISSPAATHTSDDPRDLLRCDELVVALVDGDDGRTAAPAEALDRPERDLAVVRRLSGPHAELLRERVDDVLRAGERAGQVRADLDHVPPDGLQVEHVVERRNGFAERRRRAERVRALAQRIRRQVAVLLLREAQGGQRRGAPVRVPRLQLLHLVVERGQRSQSPMTVSSEPSTAIMSATSASDMHVAVASSATNDGARNFPPHGLGPPSETR